MINVDVYIPSIDEVLDFQIDEEVMVSQVVNEMIEILTKRTRENLSSERAAFMLVLLREKRVLPRVLSLQQCGVMNGDRLLLV